MKHVAKKMLAFVVIIWPLVVSLCSAVVVFVSPMAAMAMATTGSLEEVLEHGPLFDELQDEAWWNGVEIIDSLVLSTPDYFDPSIIAMTPSAADHSRNIGRDHQDNNNNFCHLWNSCGSGSGGLVVRLPPPPPVPPQLTDLIRQVQQQQQQSVRSSKTAEHQGGEGEEEEVAVACLLCEWARLNNTVDFIPNSELSTENTWVPMLIVVALVSAMLGAVLMITALKCRRLKVLPRGGSCTTLPVGYMVGEGKGDGSNSSVQTTEMMDAALPKNYTIGHHRQSTTTATSTLEHQSTTTLTRPRLGTPTVGGDVMSVGGGKQAFHHATAAASSSLSTGGGWGLVQLWRKMLGGGGGDRRRFSMDNQQQQQQQHQYGRVDPYSVMPSSAASDAGSINAVYAELNSLTGGGGGGGHSGPMPTIYSLNTYSEIRDSPLHHHHLHHLHHNHHHNNHHQHQMAAAMAMAAAGLHHPSASAAHHLHLRRLLNGDGTYENAAYTATMQHHLAAADNGSNCSASTPSSAYYSDLSNSDGRCSHQQQHNHHSVASAVACSWSSIQQQHQAIGGGSGAATAHRLRVGSESHASLTASSMYGSGSQQQHQHHECMCCQRLQARDLMPVALQVIPDNQQVPITTCISAAASAPCDAAINSTLFCRGGVSASLSCVKRPLPPLPSRQQQRPQRRYAYAIGTGGGGGGGGGDRSSMSSGSNGGAESPSTLSCVPSEYV